MGRCKLSKALFAGALALIASSAVHARSVVFVSEARGPMTFSNAIVDTTANRASFELSSASMADAGKKVFGEIPHAAVNGGSELGWDLDAKTKLNHDTHGHEVGTVNGMKSHGKDGHDVSPVPAIPEPPTYMMLAAGLAGIAIIARHRRRGNR